MKSLFDGFMALDSDNPQASHGQVSLINDRETALRYILDIEIPVCLNLGLCYLKLGKYHHAINYCSQVLDKDDQNDKALYRRGVSYMNVGELNKARDDLLKANQLTLGKDGNVLRALQELKEKVE